MDNLDPEIKAMVSVSTALDELNVDAQARVVRWAAEKYNVTSPQRTAQTGDQLANEDDNPDNAPWFDAFVDLYDTANPDTSIEKVLVGAYWLQVIKGEMSWSSLQVNNLLKDTGNGVESISHRLETAQSQKPALVRQISKTGKSRQGRKSYKLTTAGIDLVIARISIKVSLTKVTKEA